MKTCPNCGTRYTDDTLSFCLSDGTPLGDDEAASAITVVIGEPNTLARPVATNGTEMTSTAPPTSWASRTGLAVALTALGMLILFGGVAVVGFLIWRNYGTAPINPEQNRNENRVVVNSSSPSPAPTSTAKTVQNPQPTLPKTPVSTPDAPTRATYPATQRLKMARGAFSASFGGEINPGDERSFILACRAGQSLSATVGGGSCVTFSGGGSSLSRTTTSGDNYLTVTNNCPTVARFSGRVSIF
jgi:hypothetical protein